MSKSNHCKTKWHFKLMSDKLWLCGNPPWLCKYDLGVGISTAYKKFGLILFRGGVCVRNWENITKFLIETGAEFCSKSGPPPNTVFGHFLFKGRTGGLGQPPGGMTYNHLIFLDTMIQHIYMVWGVDLKIFQDIWSFSVKRGWGGGGLGQSRGIWPTYHLMCLDTRNKHI